MTIQFPLVQVDNTLAQPRHISDAERSADQRRAIWGLALCPFRTTDEQRQLENLIQAERARAGW